ncbi:MAG: hypothetical protein LQ339_002400 [Xanthoria mediterranea]|nr:MAG: hypothetical protein LQ339_002400 [Xanthoria mediterranea]
MATSPPGSWPVQTDLDAKPVPATSEGHWKRMEKSREKDGDMPSSRKRPRELPPEIIEQILYLTDPDTFASLILVNHAWRAASQTPHLYAHHLSRCPSFSITNNVVTGPFTDSSLPCLKQQFVREVKRNLFEAYLRPRQTVVSLTSSTTSCSASFPGGEAFEFAFSPNGVLTLALSSSRIYLLDTLSSNISVRRELKVLRRPVSAAILDDGSLLAVLSIDRRVNMYDLSNASVKHLRAVTLDNPPQTIALSPKGEVLAAAYDGGIELHSLAINALATDRRSVKCDNIDSLAFSKDGTMLLGTTQHSLNPSTVVLSAPFYDETNQELPAKDVLSHMWTSQILFPNSSRDCSHATLLPDHAEGDANWTCTYDRVFESFRAVRTDDLRNGTTYFTGPKPRSGITPRGAKTKLTPCTLPATTGHGDLVAAGFLGKDVWLYGVPEGLETSNIEHTPESTTSTRQNSTSSTGRSPAGSHSRGESAELRRLPQWQVLVDKNRNVLVKGRMVAEVPGVTGVKWVEQGHLEKGTRSVAERLLVSAPGGVSEPSDIDEDGFASVDGGRLIVLDFDRGSKDGKIEQIHFELGTVEPELLEEQDMDIDAEVDIIRRRTTRQRIGHGIGTSVADALASAPELPTQAAMAAALSNAEAPAAPTDDPLIPRVIGRGHIPVSPIEGLSLEEASQVFDGPYSHSQPRSRTSLYRSATAVAANRQRNPPRIPLPDSGQIRFRRPDGRGELPHESDADNWVPPPPVYTPKPEWPLPDYLRQTLAPPIPRQNAFERRRSRSAERPRRASTVHESSSSASPQRRVLSSPDRPTYLPHRRDTMSTPDVDEGRSNQVEPVSPNSTTGLSFPTAESEISSSSSHPSPSSTHRRPVSAFVGRFRPGHRKSLTARLTSPISPMPLEGVEERRLSGSVRSVSLPSSPVRSSFQTNRPSNRLTLSGANLQSRLEYPLPPAPEEDDTSTPTRPQTSRFGGSSRQQNQNQPPLIPQEELATIPNLPSAEQLANLHNRYCHAPTPSTSQIATMPPSVRTSLDDRQPAANGPPRAALGATGGVPISPLTERRRLSIAQRNSFAASSPALLRPTPQRLDTIQSISSIISQQPSRSDSRERARGARRLRRRSRSAGPNVQKKSGGEGKRKWFGTKKGRKGKVGEQGFAAAPSFGAGGAEGAGSAYLENSRMLSERWGTPRLVEKEREKDGKCAVM